MSTYTVIEGTVIRFYTSTPFTNLAGSAADPTEVIFAYQVGTNAPQQVVYGTPQSWGTIIRDAAGTYHVDIDTTSNPGVWNYTWAGFGGVQTRAENQLLVSPASVSVTP